MSLFTIADLHLSFGVNKPMDIFKGWENYVDILKNNWQAVVKPEDTVVLPGDLSWGINLAQSKEDFRFLEELNGTKIVLKGNHDYWWETKTKIERFFVENNFTTIKILHNNHYEYDGIGICGTRGWINENGQSADKKVLNREAMRLEISIQSALKDNLKPIVFLHYPPIYANEKNYSMLEVLEKYNIKQCYYGHIHGNSTNYAIDGMVDGISYRLISSDYLKFKPLDITEFVQIVNL